jgi:hypothetical protein
MGRDADFAGHVGGLHLIAHDSRAEYYAGDDERNAHQVIGRVVFSEVIPKDFSGAPQEALPVLTGGIRLR